MKLLWSFLFMVFCLLAVTALAAEGTGKLNEKTVREKQAEAELPEKVSATQHTANISGKEVEYTATAGTLAMKDDAGKTKAAIFFVAYTKDGINDLGQRPITFAFNGGPGSSSVWLHLGMLGPKRIKIPDDASPLPPPYELTANPYSLLDITDLVFIDPVSTGFSRPASGENKDQFHGFQEDLRSVGQFIHNYVTKYGRWRSPKFLLGESYGGLRAGGLSGYLRDRYNMPPSGIIMISPALNFETLGFAPGNDLPYILFVPGYAATAWYHHALPGDLQSLSLEEVIKQATDFSLQDYNLALMKGHSMSAAERSAVAEKLARFTGLRKEYVLNCNLRISMQRFGKELLRSRDRTIGRYDSRFTGIDADSAGESPEFDPSAEQVFGPFTAAINDYVRNDLKFDDERVYEILTSEVQPWNYGRHSNRFPDASDTLRQSMSAVPYMKLFVAGGYYDLATPPATAIYSVEHMRLPPELQKHITLRAYEGGHMMYIHEVSLKKLRADLEKFYQSALPGDEPKKE
ncbi:MAG: peptidase S10 [Pirellulales bacterium]|nr:peptidase S10 [Pirellulales bacterium]